MNLESNTGERRSAWKSKQNEIKNVKAKKTKTLLNFFNQPKPSLVPLTIPSVQPVSSPAMPQENAPNTETAVSAQGDGRQGPVPIIKQPRVSPFVEKLTNIAMRLPHTIPEASATSNLLSSDRIQQTLTTRHSIRMTCGWRRLSHT